MPFRVCAQLNSKKPTAVAYSIEKTDVMRRPKGLEWHATPQSYSTDNLYLGEAHLCHYIPRTPGPGQYERAKNHSAMGKQVLTKKKHAAACKRPRACRTEEAGLRLSLTAPPFPLARAYMRSEMPPLLCSSCVAQTPLARRLALATLTAISKRLQHQAQAPTSTRESACLVA